MSEPVQGLPEFVALMKLDGVVGGKYDSDTRGITLLTPWAKEAEKVMPDYFAWLFVRAQREEKAMRWQLENVQKQHNHSRGIHTWQTVYGCELSEDEETSRVYNPHSYDGRDFLSFDAETLTWTADDDQAQMVKKIWDTESGRSQRVRAELEGGCVKLLWNLLKYGKEILLRKDTPTVKVSRVVGYNGLETLVCRVDGFYPKEIDATWRRDGQIWEQATFRGGVVPNSDGTFHTSLHVEVDPKERARYRCHVEHDALTEPLDVAWEEPGETPRGGRTRSQAELGNFIAVGGIFWILHLACPLAGKWRMHSSSCLNSCCSHRRSSHNSFGLGSLDCAGPGVHPKTPYKKASSQSVRQSGS